MSGPDLRSDPEIPPVLQSIRARTDASISRAQATASRAPGTFDLAQAIVSLARASEKRRGARADLIEATDTIAKAIRNQLRSGDRITIPSGNVVAVGRTTVKGADHTTYVAARVQPVNSLPAGTWYDVLLRGWGILGLSGAEGEHRIYGDTVSGFPADAEDRESFVMEAPAVVQAFRDLLDKQAETYETTAKRATKLTPR